MARRQLSRRGDVAEGSIAKGYWVDDPVFSIIRGDRDVMKLAGEGSLLYAEVDEAKDALFPYQDPQDAKFSIACPEDEAVASVLHILLIDDRIRFEKDHTSSFGIFSEPGGIERFFEHIAHSLLVFGEVFCSVGWSRLPEENLSLIAPSNFKFLPISTMKKYNTGNGLGYVQSYSPFGNPDYPDVRGARIIFSEDEMFYVKYNYVPPVRSARKLAIDRWKLKKMQFNKLGNTEDRSLSMERGRFTPNSTLQHKYNLLSGQIRKHFRLPFERLGFPENLEATDYYKAYRLADHMKYTNALRTFLLGTFNQQIMQRIAVLNNLVSQPALQYEGKYSTDSEIDETFERFTEGELTYQEVLDILVLRNYRSNSNGHPETAKVKN